MQLTGAVLKVPCPLCGEELFATVTNEEIKPQENEVVLSFELSPEGAAHLEAHTTDGGTGIEGDDS